jgi:drug/metabolite transporter (DMT)-like permease
MNVAVSSPVARRPRFFLIGVLGALAISVGLVQIWLGLTNRANTLHRVLGRVYGTGVLIGSLGGFYMALYSIRTRRIEQHREWMLRSYTVTFAFVTYRLASTWLERWIHVPEDPVADDLDTLLAWACWAVPSLLAEPLIQLSAMRRRKLAGPG